MAEPVTIPSLESLARAAAKREAAVHPLFQTPHDTVLDEVVNLYRGTQETLQYQQSINTEGRITMRLILDAAESFHYSERDPAITVSYVRPDLSEVEKNDRMLGKLRCITAFEWLAENSDEQSDDENETEDEDGDEETSVGEKRKRVQNLNGRRGTKKAKASWEEEEGLRLRPLHFRLDSYVHPEVWVEGVLDVSSGGYAELTKVQGRTSDLASDLGASMSNWVLRIDDRKNLPFWAEATVPRRVRALNQQ